MTTAPEHVTQLRQALGKLGIWMPPPAALGLDPRQYGKQVEEAGFRSVWFPGVNDAASLEYMESILAATSTLIAGTGIASVWHWDAAALAARADRLAVSYPGRFILGLGNSHAPVVESLGQSYRRPYSKMVAFLDALQTSAPVVLAALGPKMLQLSRDRSLGAHPYFTPPEHTRAARAALGEDRLLIPEIAVALAPGEEGRAHARDYAAFYLKLPNYTSNLKRLGFTDDDLAGGGSDRLLSAVTPNGPQESAARIREHLDAGADHVLVQLVGEQGNFAAGDLGALRDLAGGLLA